MALREKLATSDGPKSSTSGLSGVVGSVLSVILRGIRARTAEVPLGKMLLPTPRRAQEVKVYLPKLKSDCPLDNDRFAIARKDNLTKAEAFKKLTFSSFAEANDLIQRLPISQRKELQVIENQEFV